MGAVFKRLIEDFFNEIKRQETTQHSNNSHKKNQVLGDKTK